MSERMCFCGILHPCDEAGCYNKTNIVISFGGNGKNLCRYHADLAWKENLKEQGLDEHGRPLNPPKPPKPIPPPRRVENMNLLYINAEKARTLALLLGQDGYKVKTSQCEGYAGNVVSRVAGSDPDQRQEVYAAIATVLYVTDGNY